MGLSFSADRYCEIERGALNGYCEIEKGKKIKMKKKTLDDLRVR